MNESRVRSFEWNKQTQFVHGVAFSNSYDLRPGVFVHISYSVPFFGNPLVTKVIFLQSPGSIIKDARADLARSDKATARKSGHSPSSILF